VPGGGVELLLWCVAREDAVGALVVEVAPEGVLLRAPVAPALAAVGTWMTSGVAADFEDPEEVECPISTPTAIAASNAKTPSITWVAPIVTAGR
jgi:hypothetical protein